MYLEQKLTKSEKSEHEQRQLHLRTWLNQCCGVMRGIGGLSTPLQDKGYCATWCFFGTASDVFRRNVTYYDNEIMVLDRLDIASAQAILAPAFNKLQLHGFEQKRGCRQVIARCGGVPRVLQRLRERMEVASISVPASEDSVFQWLDEAAWGITENLYQVQLIRSCLPYLASYHL